MAGKYANYIMVNRSWESTLREKLTVEQCGEVFLALFDIANGKNGGSNNILVDTIIGLCGDEIKQNIENYEQRCITLKENAKQKSKSSKKAIAANGLKERMNEGRIERRTEGLLSNPSGLERGSDDPAPSGAGRQTDSDRIEPGCNRQYKQCFPPDGTPGWDC